MRQSLVTCHLPHTANSLLKRLCTIHGLLIDAHFFEHLLLFLLPHDLLVLLEAQLSVHIPFLLFLGGEGLDEGWDVGGGCDGGFFRLP